MKKILKKLVLRLFSTAPVKSLLQEQFEKYLLYTPKVVGPKERLITSKKYGSNNFIANTNSGKVIIGDYVFFGKNVMLITGTHNYEKSNIERIKDYPKEGRDIIIKEGAWIASGSIVLGPCLIGENAVVAAGSIVIKDVPANVIVAGNPAKIIKKINER